VIEKIQEYAGIFNGHDYVIMALVVLMLIFARPLVRRLRPSKDARVVANRVTTLRIIGFCLLVLYLGEMFIPHLSKQLSLTGLTLFLVYVIAHFLLVVIVKRYGRERELEGETYRTETYQSEIFSLLVVFLSMVASVLIIINIWGITDWLKATSVLGGLLIIAFSTKDVWAPDTIHGLILLNNGHVEPGKVVRVAEFDLLGIAIQTSLSETVFRDLRNRHQIVVPNSKLRAAKIEVLSATGSSGLLEFADFNLGYEIDPTTADEFFAAVWERACAADKYLNAEKNAAAKLVSAGDHALHWRLAYWVKNVYGLIDARYSINRAAYELARERHISLATPLTHRVAIEQQSAREPGAENDTD
jgi:small-conductance mechanosensitive channel